MKTQLSIILSFLFISLFSFAQGQTATTEKIKVWGNCDMCKEKIEKAAKAGGASSATWNDESNILTVQYNGSKTSSRKIQEKVAAAGYDTQDVTAPESAYKKLPGCCQYDRKITEKKAVSKATSMNCCKGTDVKQDCCKKESNCCGK